MNYPPPSRRPRQRRAAATRQRLYEAAMAEYARVGLDAARVEDIVAAAGVSWGTFFHYFPAKEDVLLDAAAEVCRAYSAQIMAGLAAGADTERTLSAAFAAQFEAAVRLAGSGALRGKLLMYVLDHPGSLTAYLADSDDDLLPPIPATTALLAEAQRRTRRVAGRDRGVRRPVQRPARRGAGQAARVHAVQPPGTGDHPARHAPGG